MDGARAVFGRHDQRRLILAGRGDFLYADNQKTSGVIGIIFDIFRANSKPEYLSSLLARYRCRVFVLRSQSGGIRVAGSVDARSPFQVRQIDVKPLVALRE